MTDKLKSVISILESGLHLAIEKPTIKEMAGQITDVFTQEPQMRINELITACEALNTAIDSEFSEADLEIHMTYFADKAAGMYVALHNLKELIGPQTTSEEAIVKDKGVDCKGMNELVQRLNGACRAIEETIPKFANALCAVTGVESDNSAPFIVIKDIEGNAFDIYRILQDCKQILTQEQGSIWKKYPEKPNHEESVFMLFCENEFIVSGFYNDPEHSDSILTGFCRWAEKGKPCTGIMNFDYWCYASELIASITNKESYE